MPVGYETDDLRADLERTLDAAETPTDSGSPSQQSNELDTDATSSSPAASGAPSDDVASTSKPDHPSDPARYADGTFKPTKAESAEKPAAAPAEATQSPSKDDQTKASTEPAQTGADAPPVGWTADAKAEWANLSPAIKAAVLKREVEISSGGRQWSEEKRRYETVLAPVAQEAARLGMDTGQALNALLAAHHALERNPKQALLQLASQYGVTLETLASQSAAVPGEQAQPQPAQIFDPRVDAIVRRFEEQERAQVQSTQTTIEEFAKAPGHEHYAAVEDAILAILPLVKQENPGSTKQQWLQEAYDRAVYANPTTRAAVLAAQAAEADAKRRAEAATRATNARKAAVSVTGAPNGQLAPPVHADLRSEIEAAFAGLQ